MINKIKDMMSKKEKSSNDENPELTEENILDQEVQDSNEEQEDEQNETSDSPNELEAQVSELKDKYLYLQAEFQNYKRRITKERFELMSNAAKETLVSLLPVLDDFDRAKKNAEDDSSTEPFSEGVMLVYNKLHNILKQKGLSEMESTGEAFDADLHEAITEIPAPSDEMKGKIIDTVEKGYFLNEKIIRHAKVVVGK